MKALLAIFIAVLLSGCTIYKVKSTKADGNSITVSVYSGRNFEAPDLHYGKDETGSVEFDFKAATVNDSNAAILQAIMTSALTVTPQ